MLFYIFYYDKRYNITGDKMIPTIIEHNGYKDYAYDIYSHLLNNRIIFLSGEINDYVSNKINKHKANEEEIL